MYRQVNRGKLCVTLVLVVAVFAALIYGFMSVGEAKAATAGNEGSFVMPATGAAASISVTDVIAPWGGSMTVYLKNSEGTTIGTNSAGGSWSGETLTFSFDEVMVYAGQTYSILIDFNPVAPSESSYGEAYLTYTPYYLITVNSAYGSPTASAYVREGSDYATSVTSPVSAGSGLRYVCTGYSVDGGGAVSGTSYTFTSVSADHTITYNWELQCEVTYTVSGLDASASGTIVTVDGAAKVYGDLPFSKWVTYGSSTTFSYASTVASSYPVSGQIGYGWEIGDGFTTGLYSNSSTSGKRFAITSYTTSPQTIYSPTTVSATYKTQYKLTVNTAYASPYPAAESWFDAGSTVSCTVTSTVVDGASGYRYVFTGWVGSGSGSYTGSDVYPTNIVMNAPITETAQWKTQCYLTVSSSYFATTGSGWYDQGATAYFNVTAPVDVTTGVRIDFNGWVGSGSGSYTGLERSYSVTMNNPITETADTYVTQYYLTVSSPYGSTTGSGWYDAGSTAYAGLTSSVVSGSTGVRYVFQSWSVGGSSAYQSDPITMSAPTTATATWATQYYLTVSSAYSTSSGEGWYNSGATAYAHVASSVDGSHVFLGWSGDASGSGITSNPITMNSPKTALATWSSGGSSPSGPVSYEVTLMGPYYEDGAPAAGDTVLFSLSFANNTVYQGYLTSSAGVPGSLYIASTSPFVQLTWNASSTSAVFNATRVYRFANGVNGLNDSVVYLFILDASKPAYEYTFSVSDYYGMINPYLYTAISTDGVHMYKVEQLNLNETGGYVTFVMQQYQIYTLTFACQQGTYTQTFTAGTLGMPGQPAVSLNVLAGNFPTTANGANVDYNATRSGSVITVRYMDASGNTSYVEVTISHRRGSSVVVDYNQAVSVNGSSSQTFTWGLADSTVNYDVNITVVRSGVVYTYLLNVPADAMANPWGSIDWSVLGGFIPTLPEVYTGWGVIVPSQLIATIIILFALGVGSYYSSGASCLISWVLAGILAALGWWQMSVPLFIFSGVLTAWILIDEYKKGAFNI